MITGKKRWLSAALSVLILFSSLDGCGQQQESESSQEQTNGKYVETEEELPEQWKEDWTIKQLFSSEGSLNLLLAAEEGEVTTLRQWQQQGEEFEDVSQEWLTNLELPVQSWADMKFMEGKDGSQYLFVRVVNEEGLYQSRLWRGKGSEAEEITPSKWNEPDEVYGSYEYILDIGALDNGTLIAVSSTSLDILSGEDGSVLESEAVTGNYGETVLSDGKNIYLTTVSGAGVLDGLEKRLEGKPDDAEQIALPVRGMSGVALCVMEDGTLIAASAEGIFRYNQISESWEKLLQGSETDFALTTCWCIGLAALEDGRLYGLFRQQDGTDRLVRYEYDPDAVTEVTQELKLYTVWENSLLQQAAVAYHREHPEVLITVDYVYSITDRYSGKAPDYDQVYQSLNTMLMGGEAPDILVMDHLNIESYAEKGLLVDIDEIVQPMEESGELLANITGAYVGEDGSRYVVPLQFGLTMALGRDIQGKDMESLEALAEFLSGKEESYLGPLTVSELVDLFYPYFCGEIVKGSELDRDTLGKKLECLKTIADNSGIIAARGNSDDDRQYNYRDLASRAKLALKDCNGFYDCMFPMAIAEYIHGDFAAYENCFLPMLQTGINVRSKYRDTALDFLKFALSQPVQDTSSGFPINLPSLKKLAESDRSDVAAVTTIQTADGGEEMFEVMPYSDEVAKRLAIFCQELERPAREDAKIREELIAALPGYLDGSRSLEQTLDSLEGGLRMYLAE